MASFKIAFLCALLAPAGLVVGAATMSVEAPCAMAIRNMGGFFVAWCPTTAGCAQFDPRPDCTEQVDDAALHFCRCAGQIDTDRRCVSTWTDWPNGDMKAYSLRDCRALPHGRLQEDRSSGSRRTRRAGPSRLRLRVRHSRGRRALNPCGSALSPRPSPWSSRVGGCCCAGRLPFLLPDLRCPRHPCSRSRVPRRLRRDLR